MKKILSLFVAIVATTALWANGTEINGIYYILDGDSAVVTYTGSSAWDGSNSYSGSITIPSTVTCSGTTFSVTSIGVDAFYYCFGLTSVTIPNSVTSIGNEAFYNCSGLTSITIPNSVTSIGDYAFSCCSGLESIIVETGNTIYDSRNNCNAIIETSTNTLVAGCKNTTIPSSVTSIGNEAFYYCSGLTSVTISNSVTSIGYDAFKFCYNLADIYCYAVNPPVCENHSFEYVSKHCYIHVPAGSVRTYQMAGGWSDFYHFYEISELPEGTPADQVGVTVTNNYATFTWPVNPTASSYTLTISKDGEVFCTLTFNSLGQLVGMAFAPARGAASAAETTVYGYSFVISGLDENSSYDYTFTANDSDNNIIESHNGSFVTEEVTAIESTMATPTATKILRDGQVLILRGDKTYTVQGQEIR